MEKKINIGIVGYGNLGKGVELALRQNPDFLLKGIFTRRDPSLIETKFKNSKVMHISEILDYKEEIDVLVLCGGSANDLPEQCPLLASCFNTVDSYDNHHNIPNYFNMIDKICKESNKVSLISVGWDPGIFSLNRLLADSILPNGKIYTFWGKGVSQGHSDAIRRIKGVKNAVQYTIPLEEALEKSRSGNNIQLEAKDRHVRVCYVVPYDFSNTKRIEEEIKSMPNYFLGYNTIVHFITDEELEKNHCKMSHGGYVICSGKTDANHRQKIEFSLSLDSNPQFTSSVLVAFARAVYRMAQEGKKGAFSVFDIPIGYISPKSSNELRRELL